MFRARRIQASRSILFQRRCRRRSKRSTKEVSEAAFWKDRRLAGYEKYVAPKGYSDQYDHFKNFFASVRSRKPVVEDAVFGYRAAGAALLSNLSIEKEASGEVGSGRDEGV